MLLEQGKINHAKFRAIIQHGDAVLADAGLRRPKPYSGPFAAWSKWRLVINRVKFKPKFKNEAEWIKGHEISSRNPSSD